MKARFAILGVFALIATPAAARDMEKVLQAAGGNVLYLDRDSVHADEDQPAQHDAVISLTNTRHATDFAVRADCSGGRLAILWSRAYRADGRPAASGPPPHDLVRPDNPLERAALKAICETP